MEQYEVKSNRRSPLKALFITGLCLLFGIYLLYHGIRIFKEKAELLPAKIYTYHDNISTRGCLFEEELPLTAEKKGICLPCFAEGERLAAGEVLAMIYPEGCEEDVTALLALREDKRLLNKAFLTPSDTVESLQKTLDYAYSVFLETGVNPFSEEETRILELKKHLLQSGEANPREQALDALAERENALLAALGTPLETLTAPTAGYAYTECGGHSAELLRELTAEGLQSLAEEASEDAHRPAFFLVTSALRTFACVLSKEDAAELTAGKVYPLHIEGNSIKVPVKAILAERREQEDSVLLLFTFSTALRELWGGEMREAVIERSAVDGYRVPKNALRKTEEGSFVFILYDGLARQREVSILTEFENFYLLSPDFESENNKTLRQNDLIFASEKGLYDGKPVE